MDQNFFITLDESYYPNDHHKSSTSFGSGPSKEENFNTLLENIRSTIEGNNSAVLWRVGEFAQASEVLHLTQMLSRNLGHFLGQALIQNEQGDEVVCVYDRDRNRSIAQGARYHQTHEGGSIHTDNVNTPDKWHYLILSCLSPAQVGGENILVDGQLIYKELQEHFPKALEILTQDFFWEMRGLKDTLYQAPIITFDEKGRAHFRHLRPYMESAHQKAQTPLTTFQLYAIDVLDALLNDSNLQKRIRLQAGDILITRDDEVLHGRTPFCDDLNAINLEEYQKSQKHPLKRTMERMWIRKN